MRRRSGHWVFFVQFGCAKYIDDIYDEQGLHLTACRPIRARVSHFRPKLNDSNERKMPFIQQNCCECSYNTLNRLAQYFQYCRRFIS